MQKSPCGPTAPPDLLPAASVSLPRETQARSQFELVGRLWGAVGGCGEPCVAVAQAGALS